MFIDTQQALIYGSRGAECCGRRKHGAPLERESIWGACAINIWPRRGQALPKPSYYPTTKNCRVQIRFADGIRAIQKSEIILGSGQYRER